MARRIAGSSRSRAGSRLASSPASPLAPKEITPRLHVVAPWGARMRLDAYLSQYVGEHSRSEWRRLLDAGSVMLNGQMTKPATRLSAGDRLALLPIAPHAVLEPDPTIPVDVLYEDEVLVVINKPTGLVVHPAPGHENGTLVHGLLARFPELRDPSGQMRPGIVHRLDKDTSGLMIVAKTTEAVGTLQRQMQQGRIRKRYRLLVAGTIEEEQGIIDVPIGRDRFNRQRMAVRPDGRPARTEFRVLDRLPGYTYVDAGLPTGRTHQLRVHFTHIGHPVAGDQTYGRRRGPAGLRRQFVHSRELTLTPPKSGKERTFAVELPTDLASVLLTLQAERGVAGRRASL
ncbi:MAG: RluA family pseudouridine synthase [Chloroflexi bacterium]|nr:RluA family pseudouridine synthase [Chloroflexota bacterium]